jgi:hypothetical protein
LIHDTHLGPKGLPAEDRKQLDVDRDDQVNLQTRVENVHEDQAVRVKQLQMTDTPLVRSEARTLVRHISANGFRVRQKARKTNTHQLIDLVEVNAARHERDVVQQVEPLGRVSDIQSACDRDASGCPRLYDDCPIE